ncbi:MAG: hypothetical protein HN348_28420, partial [Proteobacteria bacterium]|nr:hypothetical protein [Pseudomonadota bacterium]
MQFLAQRGELEADPTEGMRRVRTPNNVQSALTIDDLHRVLNQLHQEPPSWRRTRDETIISLLYYTGLRVSELQQVNLERMSRYLLRPPLPKGRLE